MDQSQISCSSLGDRLPPLSGNRMWLVAQMSEAEDTIGDQVFYNIDDPLSLSLSQYRCRVPELLGRHIRGCFHGWVIMSKHPHNVMWSLWNPATSKFIRLSPLINQEYGDIRECWLSSPLNDPGSILLLTREAKPTFVFCRLDHKRKKLRWTEMSYAKQLKNITGKDSVVHSLTCYNGKVYALTRDFDNFVIEVDIVANGKEVVISLLPFVKLPPLCNNVSAKWFVGPFMKGTCSGLFITYVYIKWSRVYYVHLVKLDMTSKLWEEMEDLDGATCFLDLYSNNPLITSKLGGGYIHMLSLLCEDEKVIYSYHVKDKTMALSCMPCLDLPPPRSGDSRTCFVSVWAMPECKLEGDCGENNHRVDSKQVDDTVEVEVNSMTNQYDSHLFNIPFHVLEIIMEFCVDIDYVNFRATCKRLTAPVTRWSNGASIKMLQRYSLVSPWLMVLNQDQGIITFTDPMFGDQYSVKTPLELKGNIQIWCSMYGWLLMSKGTETVMLFNPFTSDIRKLPNLELLFLASFCFSAPPSSPDCMIVGFGLAAVHIHFVAREPASWRSFGLDFGDNVPPPFRSSTSCSRDLYALDSEGGLNVFGDFCDEDNYFWVHVDVAPTSCCRSWTQYFLVKCDQDQLLVMMDEFGGSLELFRRNISTDSYSWEKIDELGRQMIYICDTTCLCMEARIQEMENKLFFARLHSENGKIVFYSLNTCTYHTFSGKNITESLRDLFGTKQHLHPTTWIEPSYSSIPR